VYSTLPDILLADGAQRRLAADCQALVDRELAAKSGVAAGALKVAYKVVTTFAPGYYQTTVENLVPELLKRLQPFWADFHAAGGGLFGDYLATRGEEVSEALLGVTDDMAHGSDRAVVVKAYNAVRGGAGKHIEAALPAVGGLVEKYAA
jgi:Family of unknown function (DUF6918)